jgi:peptide/nickel transport system substrate-binding protein
MRTIVVAALVCAAAVAFGEGRPLYGGRAQVALPGAPTGVDALSPLLADAEVAALVLDTPFRVDDKGTPRPLLALTLDPPPPAAAGLAPSRARLRIRTDVRFHDGTPLRAADVAASLERALRDPAGWTLAPIRAVRAASDDVVELELARPAPDLALLLSTPAASITPGGSGRAVGTGPFAVESASTSGEALELRLVDHGACFAGRAYLDAVVLRAFPTRLDEGQSFEAGALDVAHHVAPTMPSGARRAGVVLDGPQALTGFLSLGRRLPDDLAAALQAVLAPGPQSALDRDRLRRLLREPSRAATTVAPPSLGGPAWEPRTPAEVAAARTLLAHRALKLSLLVDRSRPDERPIAERILVELSRLGVALTLDAVDAATYRKRLATRDYDLALGVVAPPAPDAGLAALALLAVADPAAARAALARAPAQPDPSLLRDARVVPLYHRATRLLHTPELHGLRFDFAGRPSLADTWRAAH